MAEVTGPAALWLARHRDALNDRFAVAARRTAHLDPALALAWLKEALPRYFGAKPPDDAFLFALFDQILALLGRGALGAEPAESRSAEAVLFTQTFVEIAAHNLEEASRLVPALTHATTRLGPAGLAFAKEITRVLRGLATVTDCLNAGVLLAWRLGEARLRCAALDQAMRLPPTTVLAALGLPDYPTAAVPAICASLTHDGWIAPQELFADTTLAQLANRAPETHDHWLDTVKQNAAASIAAWQALPPVGDFVGFAGDFVAPPVCLQHERTDRHRFWVQSGNDCFRMDADCYGWRCSPDELHTSQPKLAPPTPLPAPETPTSALYLGNLWVYTTAMSFRIRLLRGASRPL